MNSLKRSTPLQWFLKSFLKGLLLVVPITVTLWVFWIVLSTIDGLLGFSIPGFGFLVTIAIVVGVGALGSTFLVGGTMAWLEHALSRVPVAKLVYFSLKDFVGAFVGEKKGFNRPVLVSLTADGSIKVLGFATAEDVEIPGAEGLIAVYVQQSYNFAGNLILVPRDRVTPLPPEESSKWLTFIVSGGVSGGSASSVDAARGPTGGSGADDTIRRNP
jgi:uncharacterized membrane protein